MAIDGSIDKDIESFLLEVKTQVIDTQKAIAKTAMAELFLHSPHFVSTKTGTKGARSRYAQGEYDANHKVIIDGTQISMHNSPTFNLELSASLHYNEISLIDQVNELGQTITIKNDTFHALAVETGVGWNVPGYATYTIAQAIVESQYGDVL